MIEAKKNWISCLVIDVIVLDCWQHTSLWSVIERWVSSNVWVSLDFIVSVVGSKPSVECRLSSIFWILSPILWVLSHLLEGLCIVERIILISDHGHLGCKIWSSVMLVFEYAGISEVVGEYESTHKNSQTCRISKILLSYSSSTDIIEVLNMSIEVIGWYSSLEYLSSFAKSNCYRPW